MNRIHPEDTVRVEIYDTNAHLVSSFEGAGFHTVEEAIAAADAAAPGKVGNPEDYAYTVSDVTTGTSARYRINAHGNLKFMD